MLRSTSGLSRSVAKWMAQLTASLGATLAASLIYAAVPHGPFARDPAPQPELTSGGKFAARAVVPVAYDGLDTMPLPQVTASPLTAAPAVPAAESAGAALHRTAWEAPASLVLSPERPVRTVKAMRAVARPEPRHVAAEAAPRAPAIVTASEPVEAASESGRGDGWIPRVVSTAREAWSLTAATSDALVAPLVAHVVPQMP